jgi:transcriptional regulator with XRE-family HTH domain
MNLKFGVKVKMQLASLSRRSIVAFMRLGDNIRTQRKTLGLTQEKLAEKAELHPVYIGSVERGEENVSIDSLVRISKALKVSLHDLVAGV